MEEKEASTTVSTSPVNSEPDSPTPLSSHPVLTRPQTESLNFGAQTTSFLAANNSSDKVKKKRGRPRKYDADGNPRASFSPKTTPFSLSSDATEQFSMTSSPKRGRGRPSGSGNWQLLASLGEFFTDTAGGDFTAHVVNVGTGEDVANKIVSLAQKGPRGVCVLSANGAVSSVAIRQPGSSGGILTYEGRFEIVSLSGSFTASDISSGAKSRTGGLSVSLAGPDGRVIGGGIAGLMTAASPIQIVVGSFLQNGFKAQKRKYSREPQTPATSQPPLSLLPPPPASIVTPIPEPRPENNSTTVPPPGNPAINAIALPVNTNINGNPNLPVGFGGWNGQEMARMDLGHSHRSPDINVTAPGEH